ncbi:MAG: hypothetical protein D6742_09230 [Cyanobacteria bacterium J069]|nr:MAG: hypothetical protein D6742_09230 [Cyanobacteria bacterium J069]
MGTLFFVIFVVPSLISGLFAVFRGDASLGLKNCSFNFLSGAAKCDPEITAKYQFLNITNLQTKQQKVTAAVQKFHTQIGEGQCQAIYEQASDLFRRDNQHSDFLTYCDGARQNFGTAASFEITAWEWLPFDSHADEYVRVYLTARSQHAARQEVLLWQIKNNEAQLVSQLYALIPIQIGGR